MTQELSPHKNVVTANDVDMSICNTRESINAKLDAEIDAAEKAHAEEFGLNVPTEGSDVIQSGEPVNTQTPSTEELQAQLEKTDKRYKDMQSHASKKEAKLQKEIEALKAQIANGGEPVDPVEDLSKEIDELKRDKETRELAEHNALAASKVAASHPDYAEVITSPEFIEWFRGQPQVYHDAIYADHTNADLAINALDLFKYQTGSFQADQGTAIARQRQEAAMAVNIGHRSAPSTPQNKMWRWSEIQKMPQHEYEKYSDAIDAAFANNRIIY